MLATLDELTITLKTKDQAKRFSKEWKRILGDGDYLYDPDETENKLSDCKRHGICNPKNRKSVT